MLEQVWIFEKDESLKVQLGVLGVSCIINWCFGSLSAIQCHVLYVCTHFRIYVCLCSNISKKGKTVYIYIYIWFLYIHVLISRRRRPNPVGCYFFFRKIKNLLFWQALADLGRFPWRVRGMFCNVRFQRRYYKHERSLNKIEKNEKP